MGVAATGRHWAPIAVFAEFAVGANNLVGLPPQQSQQSQKNNQFYVIFAIFLNTA